MLCLNPSTAVAGDEDWLTGGDARTTGSGVQYYYSASEKVFVQVGGTFEPPSSTPQLEWRYTPRCSNNDSTLGLCGGALCTTAEGNPGLLYSVFSRLLSDPSAPWTFHGTRCEGHARSVDLADVEAAARTALEERYRDIARPTIEAAPADAALVNLPVLAWTPGQDAVTLDITEPLPGQISASPTYTWTWSNGETGTGPGQAYRPSHDPLAHPEDYVMTTYVGPGEGVVMLTATWDATFEMPGVATVPLSPLVYTQDRSFPVREARTVLLDGEH